MMDAYLPQIISALAAAFLVWLATYLLLKQKYETRQEQLRIESESQLQRLLEKLDMLQHSDEMHQALLTESQNKLQSERDRAVSLDQRNAIYKERIEGLNTALRTKNTEHEKQLASLQRELSQSRDHFSQLQEEFTKAQSLISELETLLESERKIGAEKLQLLEKNKEQMKLEFKSLADEILQSNSKHFSEQNSENLGRLVEPIKKQFEAFKKQIDDVYEKETKERTMLQAEIHHIKEINQQMSKEAQNLTNALKGENKTQGIWGEMVLERVLENSGLRNGESYKREVTLVHEIDGSRYRPDVVVYLPDKREIIIDAKTSLSAYEQYVSEENEQHKKHFADQHLASVKRHINELSDKDYTGLKGVETLDFIFMFVPIESALLMAMEHDPSLFDYAFKKNVILVGPTTLMVALRAVENTWKQEHQQRNAMEIAKRAGLLYDKFVGFIESMETLGKQINKTQRTYDEMYGRLHTGAGSLTSQFQKLEKLGAAASKSLPEHLIREIEQ